MTGKASFTVPRKKQMAYVVFQGGKSRTLPELFTSAGWRHCWLMLPVYYPEPGLMAEVFTMKIESLFWGVDTDVWWSTPEVVADSFIEAGATAIVKFPFTTPPKEARLTWRGPMTCVTLTKATLLIDEWKVLTPKQLFRYLIRNGGKIFS